MLIVLKSGSLNLLEPSGPVQACNGIALPFTIKGKIFGKKLLNIKCAFSFSLQRLSKTFCMVKRIQGYITHVHRYSCVAHMYTGIHVWHTCTQVFMYGTRYYCQILMKFEFPRHTFERYSHIIFHENSSNGSRVVSCRQTDRRDEVSSRISKFWERD